MALDQKFFKKSTAGSGTDQEQGLTVHIDANDVDSYDGDGSIWYDIAGHEVNIPLADKADNLQLHLNASDTTSYGGSGTTWTDISGNDRHASIGGGFESTFEKDTRGYFHLDGSDADEATVSHNTALDITSSGLTVEAWVNPDDTNYNTLVAKFSTSASIDGYALAFNLADIYWRLYTSGAGIGTCNYTTGTEAAAGSWYHIVGTVSGTASGSTMKLYKNGTLLTTSTTTGTYVPTTRDVKIGGYDYANSRNFDGKISTVRIYNTVLTAAEVGQNYRAGNFINYSSIITSKHQATLGNIYTSNLQFDLDANNYTSGNTLTDAQGNHNGTITDATHTNDNNSDYFVLDGSGDYITIAHNNLFHMTADCSWEFLIKRNSTTNEQQIAYYGSGITYGQAGSNTRWFLNYATQSGYGFYFYNYDTASYVTSGNINSNNLPNEYEHLIITWDVSAKKFQFYYNGVLTESSNVVGGGTVGDHSATNEPLYLGKANGYTGQPAFNGNFAIARFYTSTLNATQVLQNYNAIKPLYKNPTALIDYRPDQYSGSGTSITNLGSLSNDAVLTGGIESAYDKELGDFFTIDGSSNTGDGIETTSNVTGVNLSTDGFSWELWFKITSDTYSYITSFNYSTTDWNLSYRSNIDKIQFFGGSTIAETPTLELNRWYHIVASADSNGKNLYLDGILVDSNTSATPNATLNSKIYFGTYHGHTDYSHIHTGPLGDGRFYKGVLTAEQVAQNYLATKNKYPNGHNATMNGSPTWSTYNQGGVTYNYFLTDANTEYFTIPDSPVFDLINEQSMELWIYRIGTGIQYIIDKGTNSSSNYGWQLVYSTTSPGGYFFQMHNAPYSDAVSINASSTINTWEHIVVTCNGNKEWKLYKNGSLTATDSGLTGNVARHTGGVMFGRVNYSSNDPFNGRFGMIKFYDKTLSATEVTAAYNNTKGTYGIT